MLGKLFGTGTKTSKDNNKTSKPPKKSTQSLKRSLKSTEKPNSSLTRSGFDVSEASDVKQSSMESGRVAERIKRPGIERDAEKGGIGRIGGKKVGSTKVRSCERGVVIVLLTLYEQLLSLFPPCIRTQIILTINPPFLGSAGARMCLLKYPLLLISIPRGLQRIPMRLPRGWTTRLSTCHTLILTLGLTFTLLTLTMGSRLGGKTPPLSP